jgi:hypothetical protein
MKLIGEYRIDHPEGSCFVTLGKVYETEGGTRVFEPPVNLLPGWYMKLTIYKKRQE